MSSASPTPAAGAAPANGQPAEAAPPADALRIVLFGMPDAGKSSLLGAFAQAAGTQERTLGGRLRDAAAGLAELRQRVYDEQQPRETTEEIVPYSFVFEPLSLPHDGSPPRPAPAVVYDCDGRVANELLTRRRALSPRAPEGSLTRAVLGADALVLVVDASAGPEQTDADLNEFVRFLRLLRSDRGTRGEVGGMPVFLALSKCDLLARTGDTAAAWQARIAERRSEVEDRFRDFLADADAEDEGPDPFGSLELRLGATAVRRPPLTGVPAQPREPFGVAELFRDALDAARAYRLRRRSAGRRLWYTLLGAASLLGAMLVLAGVLLVTRDHVRQVPLAGRVENYRAREGLSAATRLRGALSTRRAELTEFRRDPDFKLLPPEQQVFVESRLKELEAYIAFAEALARERPPSDARTLDELDDLEKHLREKIKPPAEHAEDWSLTEASQLRQKWLDDVPALREAVNRVTDWYDELKRRGDRLADRGSESPPRPWPSWADDVSRLQERADSVPFRPTKVVDNAGSAPSQPLLTYATVLAFPRCEEAKARWEQVRQRLERLRNLAVALGLTGETDPAKAPLAVPKDFKAADADARIEAYRKIPQSKELSILAQPESVQAELRGAAQAAYANVIEAGRSAVLRRLRELSPDDRETVDRWRQLADWLPVTPELREWRELALALGRLLRSNPEDPVLVLSAYLQQPQFEVDLRLIRVSIPDDLRDRLRPDGKLRLVLVPAEGERSATFRPDGEPERDPRTLSTVWTFRADNPSRIVLKPGDGFRAELPLKDAASKGWTLSWITSRSRVFEFERLTHPPHLGAVGEPPERGEPVPRVTLTSVESVPAEPELLPTVRFDRR